MSVYFTEGDLFLTRAQTIAHGCNNRGRMGAGIATQFKSRFPEMFKDYRSKCRELIFRPGDIDLFKSCSPWVLNMATQEDLGGARLEYIKACFENLEKEYSKLGIRSIAMPKIGAGLGGLDWEEVLDLLEIHLDPLPIPIIIYERFIEGKMGKEPKD